MSAIKKPETPAEAHLRRGIARLRLLLDMRVSDGYDHADVVHEAARHLEMYKAKTAAEAKP